MACQSRCFALQLDYRTRVIPALRIASGVASSGAHGASRGLSAAFVPRGLRPGPVGSLVRVTASRAGTPRCRCDWTFHPAAPVDDD
jgi:hypothetical protein